MKVVFEHYCPICNTRTQEIYDKDVQERSLGGVVQYMTFKGMISGGEKPFVRFEKGNWIFISCPNCGAVLNGDVCEKQLDP